MLTFANIAGEDAGLVANLLTVALWGGLLGSGDICQ